MARQFKNRPKDMKISVYLIHTRMYAQMTVVGKINPRVYNYIIAEDLLTSAIYIISIFSGVLCAGMLNQMWKQYQRKAARSMTSHFE